MNILEDKQDIKDPKELISIDKKLMVCDNLYLEKENKSDDYYTRGRHTNVDCFFFLLQNSFCLPRQTIKENSNCICLFKEDNKNMHHIYQYHVSYEEFRYLYNVC